MLRCTLRQRPSTNNKIGSKGAFCAPVAGLENYPVARFCAAQRSRKSCRRRVLAGPLMRTSHCGSRHLTNTTQCSACTCGAIGKRPEGIAGSPMNRNPPVRVRKIWLLSIERTELPLGRGIRRHCKARPNKAFDRFDRGERPRPAMPSTAVGAARQNRLFAHGPFFKDETLGGGSWQIFLMRKTGAL